MKIKDILNFVEADFKIVEDYGKLYAFTVFDCSRNTDDDLTEYLEREIRGIHPNYMSGNSLVFDIY